MKTPAKQVLADRSDRPDELVATGHQADMIFRPGQRALSLRAGKLWHLLVKSASLDLTADRLHTIALADLYDSGIGHMTQAERIETLRELQTTLVEVRVPSPKVKGRMRAISGPLLSHVERDEDDRGDLVFEFSRTLRRVFADSPHWGVLSKRAVMAFESRYSLRLFEIIAVRVNHEHKTCETFALDELRARVGLSDVVGRKVALKRRSGAEYAGLCPFHNEKTPSFTVSGAKGIFKCFGCGKAGNVVTFIQDHEKLTYPEAMRWLADYYKITIEGIENLNRLKKEWKNMSSSMKTAPKKKSTKPSTKK